MLFGHNSNVTIDGTVYHVQTEHRSSGNTLIDTTVYYQGRVLHRRTNDYSDLMPLNAEREQTVKQRLDEQHLTVIEELRSGVLDLAVSSPATESKQTSQQSSQQTSSPASSAKQETAITLELMNARSWLAGKRATLQVAVRDAQGNAVAGAVVTAHIEGAAEPEKFSAATAGNGQAQIEFDMRRFASAEPALVIDATYGEARRQLRFQLRAKPKPSTAG
jgi:hypothetical protein